MSDPISPVTLREAAGLSQAEAAAVLGIHRRTLDRYERRLQQPDAGTLEKMVVAYRLSSHLVGALLAFWAS